VRHVLFSFHAKKETILLCSWFRDGLMEECVRMTQKWSAVHQEEGEECLFKTQPWNHQRAAKGEKARTGNLQRADHHSNFANAVGPFLLFRQLSFNFMLQTKDAGFHCPAWQQSQRCKPSRSSRHRRQMKRQQHQIHQREHILLIPPLPAP
jgi:hypothetical protein